MEATDSIAEFDELLRKFKLVASQPAARESKTASCQGVAEFEKLLKDFQRVPRPVRRKKTLLEIAKFPHRELAHSNILAYFLDPNEEHGLGDLFLISLLEAYGDDISLLPGRPEAVKVVREDRTDSNKSIDIVVETDAFVIGVENKIFASADKNQFDKYWERLEQRVQGAGQKVLGILLSLTDEVPKKELCGFRPITYDDLFLKVRRNLGHKVFTIETPQLTYLVDFVKTIENLRLGTHMDTSLLNFFRSNEKTAHEFYSAAHELTMELEQRVEAMKRIAPRPGISDLKVKDLTIGDGRTTFVCGAWCMADLGNNRGLYLQVDLEFSGWGISFYPSNKASSKAASELVNKCQLPFDKFGDGFWTHKTFKYEESEEVVKEAFEKLIDVVSQCISQNIGSPAEASDGKL